MPWKYDPKKVLFSALGIPITGYAPGTFITAEHNEDMFTLEVGPTGTATRGQSNNESGRITCTIQARSPVNALLSAAADIDRATGDGMGPLFIKDIFESSILVSCELGWIVKKPAIGFGDAAAPEARVWIFETDKLIISG